MSPSSRFARPGTAIGAPVEPRHEIAKQWPIYSGSSRVNCAGCGRPTWFGPRVRALIDAGLVRPACADCLIDAAVAGELQPAGIVNLGNPERPHVR